MREGQKLILIQNAVTVMEQKVCMIIAECLFIKNYLNTKKDSKKEDANAC